MPYMQGPDKPKEALVRATEDQGMVRFILVDQYGEPWVGGYLFDVTPRGIIRHDSINRQAASLAGILLDDMGRIVLEQTDPDDEEGA